MFWDENPWGGNFEEPVSPQAKAAAEAKAKLWAEIDAREKAKADAKAEIETEADAKAEIEFEKIKEEVIQDYNRFFERELSSGDCYIPRRKGFKAEFSVLRRFTLAAVVIRNETYFASGYGRDYWNNPSQGLPRKIISWLNENAIRKNRFVRIEE